MARVEATAPEPQAAPCASEWVASGKASSAWVPSQTESMISPRGVGGHADGDLGEVESHAADEVVAAGEIFRLDVDLEEVRLEVRGRQRGARLDEAELLMLVLVRGRHRAAVHHERPPRLHCSNNQTIPNLQKPKRRVGN